MVLSCATGKPACSDNEIDVFWLVDESGSVGKQNYNKVKEMIINSSSKFPNSTCFGAVEFSGDNVRRPRSKGNKAIPLNCDMSVFNKEVNKLVFNKKGWTYTSAAMDYMANTYFPKYPKTLGRKRVMIVVTDGFPRGKNGPEEGGDGLITNTEIAILSGEIDSFVYVAIGDDVDLQLFDNVSIYDPNRDLYKVDTFDNLDDLVDIIGGVGCGVTGIVDPPVPPTCLAQEILFVNDVSHSIGVSAGLAMRDITHGFFSGLSSRELIPRVAMGTFAGHFNLILRPTFNSTIANATMSKYVGRFSNGRQKYTNFIRVSRRLDKMFTNRNTTKLLLLQSDGKPFLRNKKHHNDKVMEKQCNEYLELKNTTSVSINCIQHGKRTTPTPFFECVCDDVVFVNPNITHGEEFGRNLFDNIC